MNTKLIFAAAGVLLIFGGAYYISNVEYGSEIREPAYGDPVDYACSSGKKFSAEYGDGVVRLVLPSGAYTLELTQEDYSGIKFSNRNEAVILWTKDFSAFIQEAGETTYSGCMITPLEYPPISDQ